MQTFWLALLGLLLSGYFALGGYDLGVQMLHPFLKDRDATLAAMAPFFLGNEVWLVAFAGVLFGAFPHLEGSLLPGLYPLVAAIVTGLVAGGTAVQLRRRTRRGRRWWQALIVAGGALPAVCWGLVVGVLLQGVPRRADGGFHLGAAQVLTPFVLACGAGIALLFAAHGAAFLALRSAPDLAARARRTGAALVGAAGAAAVPALVATLLGAGASMTNPRVAALLTGLLATALAAARWALTRGHRVRAFAATCAATLAPVLLVGAGQYPYVLATGAGAGLSVAEAAADGATLRILTVFGVVLVPVILAYQAWSWWALRVRTAGGFF
ncbi:cytochrome d ubiquinol oxidase subunit II [Nonomuraea roseoviolacea subsp. roseoviolacea]|uniref:Cytochrome d ubiquinol oxidase subunit II n=1 Tax=Nonomuraea roseoviolacea subsp. carminata TaxID=160689 RepID=A0ABT1KD26_9ACTN|nr:cytochrome d ubiquinol oxidase subunit II [Nonomuraea roseoviolacea]MCP2351929.1 cytochrome d ubiquinol oxidase subunit II [Nonomuraea roseoviolacea subsp. carminata]